MQGFAPAPWSSRRPLVHRSRQIARVLWSHGLGAVADNFGLGAFRPFRGSRRPSVDQAVRLRLALGELGCTFIKLGQMLSTRADLVRADFVAELSKLQDAAPPVALEDVRRTLEEDLGAPPEDCFESFDPHPIASASIGQVHAARLRDGSEVAVKVRRPGVVEEVECDLEILAGIARWVDQHTAVGESYEVPILVEEFAFTLRNELDYRVEGQNAERLARFLADDPAVHVPRVHWAFTTARVLTLERISGVKITDLATIDRLGIPRRTVAENAVRVFLRCVLQLGLFHADPHPGNFFVESGGRLGIVDFGMVGHLNEGVRLHLLRAGLAARNMDAEGLAEELYALGVAGNGAERRAFLRDLEHVLVRFGGRSLAELSATEVTSQLTAIAYRHRLQLPAELALLFRVVSMSEGVGLTLDPEFRYLEYAAPILSRFWKDSRSWTRSLTRAAEAAVEGAELSLELPRRAGRLLSRIERGEIAMNVRHEGLESVTADLQHMTNRLALAVVLAASVVALGVAMGVQHLPGLARYLDVLFTMGFLGTVAFGVWLLISIARANRRRR